MYIYSDACNFKITSHTGYVSVSHHCHINFTLFYKIQTTFMTVLLYILVVNYHTASVRSFACSTCALAITQKCGRSREGMDLRLNV